MRTTLLLIPAGGLVPVVVAVMARAAGAHVPMGMEMAGAAGVAVVVALVAAVALLVVSARATSQIVIVQAALAATVGQMMLMAGVALGAWALGVTGDFRRFALWLLVYYWVEMPAVAAVAIRVIRRATPAGHAGAAPAH
jgi:hypothetical protein